MRSHRIALTFAAVMAAFAGASAHAATEIQFWHSMEGALGDRVNGLVDEFNKKNPEYQVKAVYKGNYGESMNAGIAAFRAGNAPDILQVRSRHRHHDVRQGRHQAGAADVRRSRQPDRSQGIHRRRGRLLPSADGKLVSMPFNSSTVVFYYNKDAFKKAGLDADKPPKTWEELAAAGQKLKAAGQECGYTTSWPSWVQLETFSAWHNVPYATKDNGFGGLDARVAVNTRCTCATWKTWPSWARKASSCTAVAATSRTRCSSAASAP